VYDTNPGYWMGKPVLARHKQDVMMALIHFINQIKNRYKQRPQYFILDGEGAFQSDLFNAFVTFEGIRVLETSPYVHEQGGPAERSGRTITEYARAIMDESGVPHSLWPEAVMTAIRILNTTPKQRLDGKTPYEMVHGHRPHLGHLRIIGSKAYSYPTRETQTRR
jgi:hypothetical protein